MNRVVAARGAPSPGHPHPTNHHGSNNNHFLTLARFWTVWRAINWIGEHQRYVMLGEVLAEYAAKTFLAHLPPAQRTHCEQLLQLVGVNVNNVGLATIGQTALTLAMTGSPYQICDGVLGGPRRAQERQRNGLTQLRFDLNRMMDEVEHIAGMPASLPPETHRTFLRVLRGGQHSLQEAAQIAYGARDCVWVKGALPHNVWPEQAGWLYAPMELEKAYSRWRAFASVASNSVKKHRAELMRTIEGACI